MTHAAALALAALGLSGCLGEKETPEQRAAAECKAHYDILWRWITARGRHPDSQAELEAAAQLRGSDPWGNPYVIELEEGRPRVWSRGPDGKEATGDDICYPPLDGG